MFRTALLCTAIALSAPLAHAQEFMLSEVYDVAGSSPDGSSYEGSVAVEIISDTTYTMEWTIGATVLKGFGMRMNDTLAATYEFDDGTPGLVIYEAGADGSLEGIWTARGRPGLGTETLTPRE